MAGALLIDTTISHGASGLAEMYCTPEVGSIRLRLGGGGGGSVPLATPDSVHSLRARICLGLGAGRREGSRLRYNHDPRPRQEGGGVGSAITTPARRPCLVSYAMHPCQQHSPSS